MKIKLIIFSLVACLLCGCSGKGVPAPIQEISLEAGSHELLAVLSDLEHIRRFADPSYYIEIVGEIGRPGPMTRGGASIVHLFSFYTGCGKSKLNSHPYAGDLYMYSVPWEMSKTQPNPVDMEE